MVNAIILTKKGNKEERLGYLDIVGGKYSRDKTWLGTSIKSKYLLIRGFNITWPTFHQYFNFINKFIYLVYVSFNLIILQQVHFVKIKQSEDMYCCITN